MIRNSDELISRIRRIHKKIRTQVLAQCERSSVENMSGVAGQQGGDTIYAIDRVSEDVLVGEFSELARERPLVLVCEGLGDHGVADLTSGQKTELRVIVDPIDGTRGFMYQKRSAWILTGIAPDRGPDTSLADIQVAVQTEIPLLRQHLCDSFWCVRGQGVRGERLNRLTGEARPLRASPSRAASIDHGFGGIARFFPGGRALLAEIDDTVVERVLGPIEPGKALAFEDQYISTGGQLYELMMGHDRWIADLRPLLARASDRVAQPGLCCHPYDLATELIAREAGVVITDETGAPLTAPLDVSTGCSWIGYANRQIHDRVAPVLRDVLGECRLL